MKTSLVVVVALVLGALLAYFLLSEMRPPAPSPTPSPPTLRSCSDTLGPGPRKAVVMVMWNKEDQCHLNTVPNRLNICWDDDLIWETAFIGRCRQYKGDLEIALKEPTSGNLDIKPAPGRATGRFLQRPCPAGEHCHLEYMVTLHGEGGQTLEEDPHVDIWP